MAKAAILLAIIALVCVVANLVVGGAAALGWITLANHFNVAIPTTIATLAAWTIVIFYFIGAHQWVKEEAADNGPGQAFLARSAQIKRLALPPALAAAVALILAYVIGGGAHSGAVHWMVHLVLALLAVAVHVVAAYRTIVLVGMMLDLQGEVG